MSCAKTTQYGMTGGLITKADAGNIPTGSFSAVINMDGENLTQYSRLSGWSRYGASFPCFLNQDLHDQFERAVTGDGISPDPCRPPTNRPVTYLRSIASVSGRRRLLAGTKTCLYAGDDLEGSWRIIGHGFGGKCAETPEEIACSDVAFKSATLANYTVFVNGVDDAVSWRFDAEPAAGETQSCLRIADLVALGITAARDVIEYKGLILMADFVESGVRNSSDIIWSDFNDPNSWIPGGESRAGRFSFGRGEKFVAWALLGDGIRIYTTQGVYHVILVADDRVLSFSDKLCSDMPVVAFPNSLISTGNEHIWLGTDSIWVMAGYDRDPRRVAWLHEASGAIFAGLPATVIGGLPADVPVMSYGPINRSACLQARGWWDSGNQRAMFSWPTVGQRCASRSMILWPRTEKVTIVDHGFTAAVSHQPYLRKSVRRVMDDLRICNANSRRAPLEQNSCTAGQTPTEFPYLYNSAKSTAQPMSPDSAIAAFCGICLDSFCGSCDSDPVWIAASAEDRALKAFEPGNCSRERLTGVTDVQFPAVSAGCYLQVGYTWVLQAGVSKLGKATSKTVHDVGVTWAAAADLPYREMFCQVGTGDQPAKLDWYDCDPLSLGPQDGGPASDEDWSRGGNDPRFKFFNSGIWINWRIFGSGIGGCVTIGDVVINPEGCE